MRSLFTVSLTVIDNYTNLEHLKLTEMGTDGHYDRMGDGGVKGAAQMMAGWEVERGTSLALSSSSASVFAAAADVCL